MATQYDPIAKDESLNTTELTPRNIADVLAEGLDDIVSALGGGSLEDLNDVTITTPSNGQTLKYNSTTQKWENANDAGGHTIITPEGTSMTQRAGLSFTDAHISDNSGDDSTDVEIVEAISKTDWDNLDATDPSNNGLYEINDPNNTPILGASMVAYGNGTVDDALTWKFQGSALEGNSVQLPSAWNEIQILAYCSTNISVFNLSHTAVSYYHTNVDTRLMLSNGRYASNIANLSMLVDVFATSCNIRSAYWNGSDDIANCKLFVFYR